MSAADWTKALFVLLLVVGFGLPFAVYFIDVYKGRQELPFPIIDTIKRRLSRLSGIGSEKERGASAEPAKSAADR
jgi:hypothetical protein